MEAGDPPRRFRRTRKRWIVLHVFCILLIAYVSSYASLSRQRWKEYQGQLPGFLYVSRETVSKDPEGPWPTMHQALAMFYAPANRVDREIFGGPSPLTCVMTIGRKKHQAADPRE